MILKQRRQQQSSQQRNRNKIGFSVPSFDTNLNFNDKTPSKNKRVENSKHIVITKPPTHSIPKNIFGHLFKSPRQQDENNLQNLMQQFNKKDSEKKKKVNKNGWFFKKKLKTRSHSANSIFESNGKASSPDMEHIKCRSNSLFKEPSDIQPISNQLSFFPNVSLICCTII